MAFCDFVVRYNPSKDTHKDVAKRILYTLFIKRIKGKKPAVTFIGGDSGEGKSESALTLQDALLEIQGIDLKDYMNVLNIYTPLEYPVKLDRILFDKELKKANVLILHEAREVVKAKLWHSFLNQSISDVNAMSRSVKRLVTIVISQFIRDIDASVRYTLTYYCIIRRPLGKSARLYINVMWKDDRDLEKPRLRKRKISGYLVYPNGRYQRYVPKYLELRRPRKEIIEMFEKQDREAKIGIIRKKIDKMIKEMREDIGAENNKVNVMLDWYIKHPEQLTKIGRMYRGKWKLRPEVKTMHELSIGESQEFEEKLNESLKKAGYFGKKEEMPNLQKTDRV